MDKKVIKLTLTAVMAALSYVVFAFLQIRITLPGGDATSFHLGNAVCVLAALLLGGVYGGIAGAIGMTIGDLFDPVYVIYAPKTFLLKFCIGLITGLVAHKIGHITHVSEKKHVLKWTIIAAVCGMLFNFIFDPLIGYLYKILIIGKSAAEITLAWNVLTTGINAAASVIVAVIAYIPIRKALMRGNMFMTIGKSPAEGSNNDKEDTSDK